MKMPDGNNEMEAKVYGEYSEITETIKHHYGTYRGLDLYWDTDINKYCVQLNSKWAYDALTRRLKEIIDNFLDKGETKTIIRTYKGIDLFYDLETNDYCALLNSKWVHRTVFSELKKMVDVYLSDEPDKGNIIGLVVIGIIFVVILVVIKEYEGVI